MSKEYLGDGVYASHDGYQIWLETSDGVRTTNRIALEPAVLTALEEFISNTRATAVAQGNEESEA